MRGNEFLDKMELIDPAYVEAADAMPKKKKKVWVKWGAMAACLCLVIAGAVVALHSGFQSRNVKMNANQKSGTNQILLSKDGAAADSQGNTTIQLGSAKQGLCLPDDNEANEIAIYVAPSETQNEAEGTMSIDDAEQYAYLDYDSATAEMKEKIQEARKVIIFSSNWVADGYSGCIQDAETGETIQILPSFSELFPDWDIPAFNISKEQMTEDGLGADGLYGLSLQVIQVTESNVICSLQEQMNLFEANQKITVFLPENSTIESLGLKIGDEIFVSYFGRDCSISDCTIYANEITGN